MARLGRYEPEVQRLATELEREFRKQDAADQEIRDYLSGPLLSYLEDLAASVGFTPPPAPPWA